MSLLRLDDVHVKYGQVHAVRGVSLSIEAGEVVALVGSNGAGKSSTLKAILAMVPTADGAISIDGRNVAGLKPWDITQLGVGFSPEGRRVFPALSVLENLRVGGYSQSRAFVAERIERVFSYFPALRERARQRAGSLSGGEQQMLAIGRALMPRTRLFLLDEPSLGVAPLIVDKIGEILAEVAKQEQLGVLLAEQNASWALDVASRGLILELGRLTLAGDSSTLRDNPDVRSAYLGV
jgi:branched-chain amino acid transport system ATP-binding protein